MGQMDFDIKKPSHIFSLVLISITFLLIVILPVLTFFGFFQAVNTVNYQTLPKVYKLFFEIFLLVFQLTLVILLMIVFPFIWYFLVNKYNLKQVLSRLKLTLGNIDMAFLWGILTTILIFAITIVIGILIVSIFGVNAQDMGNIPDLEALFSPISLFLLVAIQPVAEEIFFRGFLLDKIESFAGQNISIVTTSVLFGLAHASYGKVYPIILPIIMGVLLAYMVIKTKNLYTSIIAHVCFNVGTLALTFLARSLMA